MDGVYGEISFPESFSYYNRPNHRDQQAQMQWPSFVIASSKHGFTGDDFVKENPTIIISDVEKKTRTEERGERGESRPNTNRQTIH